MKILLAVSLLLNILLIFNYVKSLKGFMLSLEDLENKLVGGSKNEFSSTKW